MSLRQAAAAALLGALALTGCAAVSVDAGFVAADDGGRFYTDDHYDSFTEVVSG